MLQMLSSVIDIKSDSYSNNYEAKIEENFNDLKLVYKSLYS